MRSFFLLLLFVLPCSAGLDLQQNEPIVPKLGDRSRLVDWELDGSGTWDIADGKLKLVKAGTPSGPIRRPAALAILKTQPFTDVSCELEVTSTAPVNVPRRDVDLVIGYESPTRFYYIHLAAVTDQVHNGIFLVAGADRKRIDSGQGQALMKDQKWHRVRVTRDGTTGRIEVFFDKSKIPILSAVDTTITSGRVGVGSFDDTAEFRRIRVRVLERTR